MRIALLITCSILIPGCWPALRGPAHAAYFASCPPFPPATDQVAWRAHQSMCVRTVFLDTPVDDSDPVAAATMVGACVATGLCVPEPGAPLPTLERAAQLGRPVAVAGGTIARDLATLAVAVDLAERIEPEAVERALRGRLDARVTAAFVERYRAAREELGRTSAGLGARWRAVFVTPAQVARAAWRRDAAALASWDARMAHATGALERAAPDQAAAVLARMIATRDDFVAACAPIRSAAACVVDPRTLALTRAIAVGADRAHDVVLATTELRWAQLPVLDLAVLEYRAAQAALVAEAARRIAYDHDRARGLGATALARRWPSAPFAIGVASEDGDDPWADRPGLALRPRFGVERRPEPALPVTTGGIVEAAPVRAVIRRGDRARLAFKKDVLVTQALVNCWDTNRVERIEDGRFIYARDCDGRIRTVREDRTRPDVEVPWADAARLVRGDEVEILIDEATRHGRVWRVYQPARVDRRAVDEGAGRTIATTRTAGRVLQLRGVRFAAADQAAVAGLWERP